MEDMTRPRVFWSVTPEQTKSPYIRDIADEISARGWRVEPFSLRDLLATSGEVVHVQWPEHVSRGSSTMSTAAKHARTLPLLAALRLRNHSVVLTAHNRAPHGTSDAIDAWFRSRLEALAEAVIVLVPGHEDTLRSDGAIGPHARVVSIPHPVHWPPAPIEFVAERNLLVVLGQIHPYHQIEEFIEAFDHAVCPYDVLIAGGVGDTELTDQLQQRAAENDWLTVRPGFATDADLAPFLARAAAVVSLQRRTFNSGGPFFALPRNLPIIMTAGAQAEHLSATVGTEWVFPVPASVHDLDCAELNAWLGHNRSVPDLSSFNLDEIAALHIELYGLLHS